MTREEALKTYVKSVANLINSIYDDFESRVCKNCNFNLANKGKEIGCVMIAIEEQDMTDDFGCNKWESIS